LFVVCLLRQHGVGLTRVGRDLLFVCVCFCLFVRLIGVGTSVGTSVGSDLLLFVCLLLFVFLYSFVWGWLQRAALTRLVGFSVGSERPWTEVTCCLFGFCLFKFVCCCLLVSSRTFSLLRGLLPGSTSTVVDVWVFNCNPMTRTSLRWRTTQQKARA
jgi:hypothetical protein